MIQDTKERDGIVIECQFLMGMTFHSHMFLQPQRFHIEQLETLDDDTETTTKGASYFWGETALRINQ